MRWDPAPVLDTAALAGIALKEENVIKVGRDMWLTNIRLETPPRTRGWR